MRILAVIVAVAALLAGAAPAEAQNRFWLQNNTGQAIVAANVSPSRVQEWGPNILTRGPVAAGMQVWVEPPFADCYLDIKVRFADGTEDGHLGVHACTLSRITFGPDMPDVPTPPPPTERIVANPSFTFVNGSGQMIREIYAVLTTERNWGVDRLGRRILPPGAAMPISLPRGAVCTANLQVRSISQQLSLTTQAIGADYTALRQLIDGRIIV